MDSPPYQTIIIRRVILSILFLAVQGCYVQKTVYTENVFNTWLGKPAAQLLHQFGAPTRMVPDGQAGQIYIYDYSYQMSVGYSGAGYLYNEPAGLAVPGADGSQLRYQPGQTVSSQHIIQRKMEFFVDAGGAIYAWHLTGFPTTARVRYSKKDIASGAVDTTLFQRPTQAHR